MLCSPLFWYFYNCYGSGFVDYWESNSISKLNFACIIAKILHSRIKLNEFFISHFSTDFLINICIVGYGRIKRKNISRSYNWPKGFGSGLILTGSGSNISGQTGSGSETQVDPYFKNKKIDSLLCLLLNTRTNNCFVFNLFGCDLPYDICIFTA